MDLTNGDIAFKLTTPAYSSNLTWVDEDDEYVYGECILDNHLTFDNLVTGIGLYMTRSDSIKKVKIKFTQTTGRGDQIDTEYLSVYTLNDIELTGAKLITVSDDLYVRIYLSEDRTEFTIVQGYWRDFHVVQSIDQNEFLLLIANASSIYSSSLTGVGIQSYLNGDIRSSDLSTKIQSEFDLDGVTVSKIQFDEETNEIIINSTER